MIKVRSGVFETNSSSMHSIAVRKQHSTITDKETGHVYLYNGKADLNAYDLDFGRYPFEMLCSMMDKARYVIASRLGGYPLRVVDDEDARKFLEEELYPIIKKYIPNFVGFEFDTEQEDIYHDPSDPEKVYRTSSKGVRCVGKKQDSDSGYALEKEDGTVVPLVLDEEEALEVIDYGSIDHQSFGLLDSFFKKTGVSLEDFLTDTAYIVVIDGDEYCDFEKYLQSDIIHTDDIDTIYTSSPWFGRDLENKPKIIPVPCDL